MLKIKTVTKLIPLLISISLLTACSKNNKVPDPPRLKTQIVVEFFTSLKQKDYQLAEQKIDRLKDLYPNNTNLMDISTRIQNNLYISQVQNYLDNGEIDKGYQYLNDIFVKLGYNKLLSNVKQELETLETIGILTDQLIKTESSKETAMATAKLNREIINYTPSTPLSDYTLLSMGRAKQLLEVEKDMAIEDLKAFIDIEWVSNSTIVDTLMASLEVANPDDPEVIAYRKSLSPNWKSEDTGIATVSPQMEFILFRKALSSTDKLEREDIFKKLLYLPPNNFKSYLIRALILESMGLDAQSKVISSKLKSNLSLSGETVNQWYQAIPSKMNFMN